MLGLPVLSPFYVARPIAPILKPEMRLGRLGGKLIGKTGKKDCVAQKLDGRRTKKYLVLTS